MTDPAAGPPAPGMPTGRTLLFAVAGGAAVSNLYWAQPLLEEIGRSLGVSTGAAGALLTVTQVGYALGIFLVVPLGDVLDRRRLVPAVVAASALALVLVAVAPTFPLLLLALALVGLTTVAAQVLGPLAGDLALPQERGRVVGTVVSGALIGILLSRTVSGVVADLLGWRAVYLLAAAVAVVLALLLRRAVPRLPARERIPYPRLLASVLTQVRGRPLAQVTIVLSAVNFAVFTMFWTALTFLLSAEPFSYSLSAIGLVGLAGLLGALAARGAGRLHDRGWSVPANGAALAVALVCVVVAGLAARSIVVLLLVVVVFDVAVQATSVLSQTRLFAAAPQARSRLNTALVTANFVGAALGSAAAGALWHVGGWTAVSAGAAAAYALALLVWLAARHRALAPAGGEQPA
ncbi:MFS transporter [Kineococcus vitellinus]|uniref:MFS transporter n=1 Tax=Kineococcus vitellinus TaxID=2696565 RepID=UPI00196B9F65